MNYGQFSENGKEYIIHDVETPRPWINYIYNKNYFSTVSNNAGGISYYKIPLHGRITRYRINEVPYDRPGKYVYLKDRETGKIWSLSWQPVGADKKSYEVRHGFGYSKFFSEVNDIKGEMVCFVPMDADQEIWKIKLKNQSNKIKKLDVYGYVEFCLGHAMVDLINQCDDQHFNRLNFDSSLNTLFATKTYWVTETKGTQQQENKSWDRWAFFNSNLPVEEYETIREKFIGLYRNENNPIGVETGSLSSEDADYGNSVGALKLNMELQPGEEKEFVFNLGVIDKERFIDLKENSVRKYTDLEKVKQAFDEVNRFWDRWFENLKVETPDKDANVFMNYWNAYQAKVAFDVGRVASFYYWGIGRGFGFRDTSQDILAVLINDPAKAKERIRLLSRQIFKSGKVYHHFYQDGQGETTGHCDDPLWYLLAVTEYIKETGDFSILDHEEPFVDKEAGTVLEHMMAVVEFVKNNMGAHGLPIFGRGDWNDTLDYIGGDDGGESVWGGMFYLSMLNLFSQMLEEIDREDMKREVDAVRERLEKSLYPECWDGEWFIRAYGAKNRKIGSKENDAGKIFLNTQSWAVIAGLGDEKIQKQTMDSVKDHLDTEFGIKICAPAFKEIDPNIGLITRCVAGKKENGAIFNHPVTWAVMAECLLKRGDRAYEIYKKHLPNRVDADVFQSEPYVFSQYITSDEHGATAGMASHSWQTGTAAWMFKVVNDYVLGVKADYKGLRINPCIPSNWKEYRVTRIYRGIRYVITVENPKGVQSGISLLRVNGEEMDSNLVPYTSGQSEVRVEVILG